MGINSFFLVPRQETTGTTGDANSQTKDNNNSRGGGNSRDFSHSRYYCDVNTSKNNNSMQGHYTIEETTATSWTQGKPTEART